MLDTDFARWLSEVTTVSGRFSLGLKTRWRRRDSEGGEDSASFLKLKSSLVISSFQLIITSSPTLYMTCTLRHIPSSGLFRSRFINVNFLITFLSPFPSDKSSSRDPNSESESASPKSRLKAAKNKALDYDVSACHNG